MAPFRAAVLFVMLSIGATPAQTTNAALGGTVTGQDAQPLRRVTVTLTGAGVAVSRVAVTDDRGRFLFDGLPAGRFTITASRSGYLTMAYGATRGWRSPGVPIAIGAGERVTDLAVQLPKGGVITGRVTDPLGQPLVDVRINVREVRVLNGQTTYAAVPANDTNPTGANSSITPSDDRGIYRIYGLPPGTFVVSAYRIEGDPSRTFEPTTAADVEWARTSSGAGAPAVLPAPAPSVGYVPVFFPGTPDAAAAAPITLTAGEERAGVDFVVDPVRFSTIRGRVTTASGAPVNGASLYGVPMARDGSLIQVALAMFGDSDAQGNYTMHGVPPGRVAILARARGLFGQADVDVRGDVPGLNLQMLPGVTVTGRVVMEDPSRPLTADALRARVRIAAPPAPGASMSVPAVDLDKSGNFKIDGVGPGSYLFSLMPQGADTWMVKSATFTGRDLSTGPLEVAPGLAVSGIVVTLTDRVTEISGALLDRQGRPAPDFFVLAYPVDRKLWSLGPSRLRPAVRPGSDGHYRIAGLPPGEYWLAAITEIQPNDYADPSFLELLVPGSVKISLGDGEKRTQNVMLAGG